MKSNTLKSTGIPMVGILKSDLSPKMKMTLIYRRIRNSVGNVPIYMMLIVLSFIFLLPFYYMLSRSVMTPLDLAAGSTAKWVPRAITFSNYKYAFLALNYWKKLWVSVYSTGLAVLGQLISCTFVAYGLARIKFRGNGLIFALVLFTLIVPPQTIILPLFVQYKNFGWHDTFLPIIIPSFFGLGLNGGLFIFIYRQFFRGLPDELENAALIDGCGIFSAFFRVIVPNTRSAMLVCTILSLVWQWNNYFEPSVYIRRVVEKGNLVMQLAVMDQNAGLQAGNLSAGANLAAAFLCVLPIMIIFFLLQGQFMKGIERVGLAN